MDIKELSIKQLEQLIKDTSQEDIERMLACLKEDSRSGARKLYSKMIKEREALEKLKEEWQQKLSFDEVFKEQDKVLVGIDEVGRGPLAGPVVACAVILPDTCELLGVKDSKKLSEEKREMFYDQIMSEALHVGIGIVEPEVIDEINILQATFRAMRLALENLESSYDIILVDGDKTIPNMIGSQHAIIKGDNKSAAIAASSIIAKVTRDRMMKNYAKIYHQYDWESNKGYGSQKHYDGIRTYGITPLHRKTFLKNEGF